MENKNMYRILVVTIFILLMTVGIYIGVELSEEDAKDKKLDLVVSNTESIDVYNEDVNVYDEEQVDNINIKFTDVYPDCGHNIESEEHQQDTTKLEVKKQIEEKDIGYKLIGEQDGVLIYKKVHTGKCMNHYMVLLENDIVTIYRMSEGGEFEIYQTTNITSKMLREGVKEQLEIGVEVNDVEELFLLMEDLES